MMRIGKDWLKMLSRTRFWGSLPMWMRGKTTLSEQMLYQAGVLRTPGRVDARTAFLDQAEIEGKRGITVFSGQADFSMEAPFLFPYRYSLAMWTFRGNGALSPGAGLRRAGGELR